MSTLIDVRKSEDFDWKRWPETEAFVDGLDRRRPSTGNAFAAEPGRADARPRRARGSRTGSTTWS